MNIYQLIKDRLQGKALPGQKRSSKWRKFRREHIGDECASCGSTTKLEFHHIIPFSMAPDLELDPENCMTLCENKKYGINCHIFNGHNGNFRKFNLRARSDSLSTRDRVRS